MLTFSKPWNKALPHGILIFFVFASCCPRRKFLLIFLHLLQAARRSPKSPSAETGISDLAASHVLLVVFTIAWFARWLTTKLSFVPSMAVLPLVHGTTHDYSQVFYPPPPCLGLLLVSIILPLQFLCTVNYALHRHHMLSHSAFQFIRN